MHVSEKYGGDEYQLRIYSILAQVVFFHCMKQPSARILQLSLSFTVLVHIAPCCPSISSLQRRFGFPLDLTFFFGGGGGEGVVFCFALFCFCLFLFVWGFLFLFCCCCCCFVIVVFFFFLLSVLLMIHLLSFVRAMCPAHFHFEFPLR